MPRLIILPLLLVLAFTACESPGRTGALAGAAAGAIIGGSRDRSGHDALRGAAIGAGAGYLIGKLVERSQRRHDLYEDDGRLYDRSEDENYDGYRGRYPVADHTERRGFVRSPYRPYHLIDVRGIPHGARVLDPSNERVFINP